MNNITLMGRLTADPELKQTSSNIAYCHCTLAVDKPYTKGKEKKEADFIPCTAWRSTAELICKYFTKGSAIIVTGSLVGTEYTDKAGVKHKSFDVLVDKIHFLPKSSSAKSEAAPAAAPAITPELMSQVMAAMGKTSTP